MRKIAAFWESFILIITIFSSAVVSCSGNDDFGIYTRGSNITNGQNGVMYQDKSGTLWSMGYDTPLQYFDSVEKVWKHDTSSGLTRGSNISNGEYGAIFEDSSGTLWSGGFSSTLQYYDKKEQIWKSSLTSGKTNGSNIRNCAGIKIFEDNNNVLWTLSLDSLLQYWDDTSQSWISDTKTPGLLTYGSNVTPGLQVKIAHRCSIFQDSRGVLWSAGYGNSIQYWDDTSQSWISDTKTAGLLTYGSNIKNDNAFKGFFEDNSNTLWSFGCYYQRSGLQYWDADNQSWKSDRNSGKTNGSVIIKAIAVSMFQDKNGILWSMGDGTKLQYLDEKHGTTWDSETNSYLLHNSNITDGYGGFIFQDSSGTLFSGGNNSCVQYYDSTKQSWIHDITTPGSKLYGLKMPPSRVAIYPLMFEDHSKRLWFMCNQTPLQYWDAQKSKWVS